MDKLRYENWIHVPVVASIKMEILDEFLYHPMLVISRSYEWVSRPEICISMAKCLTFQHVRAEYQRPAGLQ